MSEKTAEEFFKVIERKVAAKEEHREPQLGHNNLQGVFEHVLNTKQPSGKKTRNGSSLKRVSRKDS